LDHKKKLKDKIKKIFNLKKDKKKTLINLG
jgi:hypothetical protein